MQRRFVQPLFADRIEAGRLLAAALQGYRGGPDVIVLGLPRGGIPVAHRVAEELGVPLDVFLVRKLGVPGHEELAMGAIATGGVRVLSQQLIDHVGIPQEVIEEVTQREAQELVRRERVYRGERPPAEIAGRTVILIDDGLATGSTMRAAVAAVRKQGPRRMVVAVPVAAADTCEALRREVEEVVCLETPEPFFAVGMWYEDFTETSDAEVRELLERAWRVTTHA
jgi:putative phosphoribosyl transferase